MLDAVALRRFLAVVEAGNVTKAADMLHVAQPAMTRSLRLLEEDLGVRLFERGPRGVVPTPFALALLPFARSVAEQMRLGREAVLALRGLVTGQVRLGVTPNYVDDITAAAVAAMHAQWPGVAIQVTAAPLSRLMGQLRRGEVDLLFGLLDERAQEDARDGLQYDTVCVHETAIFARRVHPLAGRAPVGLADMASQDWMVIADPDNEIWEQAHFFRFFDDAGLEPPRKVIEVSSVELMKKIMARTDILGFVSVHNLREELRSGDIVRVADGQGLALGSTGFVYRPDAMQVPAVQAMRKALESELAAGD